MTDTEAHGTLVRLRDRLAQAECELLCADMIDNYSRRAFEMKRARERIASIELEIGRLENPA